MSITSSDLVNMLYYKLLPSVYREGDGKVNYSLKRYIEALVDGGFLPVADLIRDILNLIDPEKCPDEFLPYLCRSFGVEYFNDIDPTYQRRFISNIGELIRRRGTYACIRYIVSSLTGLGVDLYYYRGYNEEEGKEGRWLIVTLLAQTLDQVINIDTSIKVVERYVQLFLPYYINVGIKGGIDVQVMEGVNYINSFITQGSIQTLKPLNMGG